MPLPHTGGPLCPDTAYNNHVADYPDMTSDDLPQPAFMYDVKGKRVALSHSFLLGAATQQVMALGDWVSLAVLGYNETEAEFPQALPRRMASAAAT